MIMSEVSRLRQLCQRFFSFEWSQRRVAYVDHWDAVTNLRQRAESYERQLIMGEIDGVIFLPVPKGSGTATNFAELEEALLREIYLRAPELCMVDDD